MYREQNRDKHIAYHRAKYHATRKLVLEHYSNGVIECACCGEKEYRFMTIDHVNNDGAEHRKTVGSKYICSWLIQNNFPDGFQVLCANCNQAKRNGTMGICPHKEYQDV
jgi:hypothetical protein